MSVNNMCYMYITHSVDNWIVWSHVCKQRFTLSVILFSTCGWHYRGKKRESKSGRKKTQINTNISTGVTAYSIYYGLDMAQIGSCNPSTIATNGWKKESSCLNDPVKDQTSTQLMLKWELKRTLYKNTN